MGVAATLPELSECPILIYPVKTVSSLWQAAKSSNYETLKEIFSFKHLTQ